MAHFYISVYIMTNLGYVRITYSEFCRIRKSTENYIHSHWFIPVQGILLEVPKETYKAFYREKERERYLRKLDNAHFLFSLDSVNDGGAVIQADGACMEDQIENRLMLDKLHECLARLTPDESELLQLYFFQHVPRKELARRYGVHPSNISRRIAKILAKLKKLMEK